jgi:micrococcal nuclease
MQRLAGVAVIVMLAACASGGPDLPPGEAVVEHPVDGDTVVVRLAGHSESIRLIGIDTPESVARDRPVECFGAEAKHRTAELLPEGTPVRLERDIEARDKYGRLLAYVFRVDDGTFVNLLLVQEGYAEAFPFEPNTAHRVDFARAEEEARSAGRGLWPGCGGTDVAVAPPPG